MPRSRNVAGKCQCCIFCHKTKGRNLEVVPRLAEIAIQQGPHNRMKEIVWNFRSSIEVPGTGKLWKLKYFNDVF